MCRFLMLCFSAVCFFINVCFSAVVGALWAFLSSRQSSALYCFSCIVSVLMNKIFSHSILTNRLRPSATDWLLTCTAFCCDIFFFVAEAVYRGSCDFFDTADVKKLSDFLLRNNILLISSDKYFETVFWVAKSYTAFRCTYSVRVVIFEHWYFTK